MSVDVRSCRIMDHMNRFELFPNGHEHFLSRGALKALNAARRDALKAGDDTIAPYRDEEVTIGRKRKGYEPEIDGETGERKNNIKLGVADVSNLTLPKDWTIQSVFSGLSVTTETTAGPSDRWNWRSTRIPELEGVFGAGHRCSVTFRVVSRIRQDTGNSKKGFIGLDVDRELDIEPDSVIFVKLIPAPKGSDDENLVRLFVIDVIWGYKSLVNYIVKGASYVSSNTQQRDGYLICRLAG